MILERIRRMLGRSPSYPRRIKVRNLAPGGCVFEVTGPIEEGRVSGLGEEEEFLRLLLAEVECGDVLFDVGSCVGLHALHAALKGARVVAFEPDPSYRDRLIRNIKINSLAGSVTVVEWAVSDRNGTATLYSDGVEGMSPSLVDVGDRGSISVNSDSIDNSLAEGRLPIPNMVKMDIEGAEILALRGMRNLLGSNDAPRCLFIEFHPQFLTGFGSSVGECTEIVDGFGYRAQYFKHRTGQIHVMYRRCGDGRTT